MFGVLRLARVFIACMALVIYVALVHGVLCVFQMLL